MSELNAISIPRWLAKVVVATCALVSSIAVLGIPWANYVAGELGGIKTQLVSIAEVNSLKVQHMGARLAVNEAEVKELRSRLRDLEQRIQTRTTSRPISKQ